MSVPTVPAVASERSRRIRSWLIIILTNVISLAFLGMVLSGSELTRIRAEIKHMHWPWVAVAVFADVTVYLLHGLRWRLLLRPIQRIPYFQLVRAIYAGLYANEVIPLRAGELIRCFLLSRSSGVPISVTFASALIERIFDGIWLMICFFITMHLGRLPGPLVKAGYILSGIVIIASSLIAFGMYARKQSLSLFFEFTIPAWFNTLIEDLHLIGHSRFLYYSFFVSGVYLFAQVLPIYAVVRAYGLPLPWPASFTMMVLLRLAAVVPQAPGNLGLFQWVSAQTLMIFGIGSAYAKRFSLVLWAIVTLPLIVVGLVVVFFAGVSMSHLHRQATSAVSSTRADDEEAP